MKNTTVILFKLILIMFLMIYTCSFDMSILTNKIVAALTLAFSILFLYKSRKSLPIFLIAFFIFYCNYSITIGEYLVGEDLGAPMVQVKTIDYYGLLIRIMLLFISTLSLFFNSRMATLNDIKISPRDNIVVFYGLLFLLLIILIFGIKRGDLSSYTVSITPIYEYSTLLFLIAYLSSGKSIIRRGLYVGLIILFILQDVYYGGRITSLQLILLLLVTIGLDKLTVKLILFGGSVGIFFNSLVDAYRYNYSLGSIDVITVFHRLIDNLLVFNTPVYAYYASATHVATYSVIGLEDRLASLFTFLGSIIIGANKGTGDVTFVSNMYFNNHGGGVIPSFFYFWFGWTGVIIITLIIVYMLNRIGTGDSDYWKVISITLVYSVPRWYLYSPLSLIRPLILISILYLTFRAIHLFLLKIHGKQIVIKETKLVQSKT